jgi:hypothetical protein
MQKVLHYFSAGGSFCEHVSAVGGGNASVEEVGTGEGYVVGGERAGGDVNSQDVILQGLRDDRAGSGSEAPA